MNLQIINGCAETDPCRNYLRIDLIHAIKIERSLQYTTAIPRTLFQRTNDILSNITMQILCRNKHIPISIICPSQLRGITICQPPYRQQTYNSSDVIMLTYTHTYTQTRSYVNIHTNAQEELNTINKVTLQAIKFTSI